VEIFGVGGLELVAILIIMLVVGGPKRMAQWAYQLGQAMSKLRAMWKTVAVELQKEFDAAGVDVKVPEQIPNRAAFKQNINRQLDRAFQPVTKPLQDSLQQARVDLKPVEAVKPPAPTTNPAPEVQDLGVWSNP
jgi:Sec-independent protein translocase protein TatA